MPVAGWGVTGASGRHGAAPRSRTCSRRPSAPGPKDVYYKNCTEAKAAGAAPIRRGQPGYGKHLDRDNDGIACDK
ncbi:hypothetical protein DRB89_39785 [Streptomyces sp. ICC4]|nr:hypothetical protein DRB89_39785 [Streptomyces sp. ICC4]